MGVTFEINSLEEMCDLMCDNRIPEERGDKMSDLTNTSNTLGALDCVDRNEAIKNLEKYKDLFSWDDGDRERCVLTRVIKELKAMSSVHPEVIRCKDCKYSDMTSNGLVKYCDIWFPDDELYQDGDYFCADGELRGEQDE